MPLGRLAATVLAAAVLALAMGGCANHGPFATDRAGPDASGRAANDGAIPGRPAPERVSFDSLDRDPATGAPVPITGLLFRPANPDAVRRPAIVALHGCGGMYSALASRRDKLAGKLAAAGEPVTVTAYPDTYHAFDGPASQPRLRLDVPNGVNPGQGVTVAPNPAAREDAYARLKAFLRAQLGDPARVGSVRDQASPAGR